MTASTAPPALAHDVPVSLAGHWDELVTAALLGTDRRPPPMPPPGPLDDLVADTVRTSAAARMLADVAATTVALRAGRRPGPVVAGLQPPTDDPRPLLGPGAVAMWTRIVADWPVLEDEFFVTAVASGRRLPADVVVPALLRHRGDAARSARVAVAAGPIVGWLAGHVPELGLRDVGTVAAGTVAADEVVGLPALAMPPELAALLDAASGQVVGALRDPFAAGRFGNAHRAVLVNFVARCRVDALDDLADALGAVAQGSPAAPLALALADLARTRSAMRRELA